MVDDVIDSVVCHNKTNGMRNTVFSRVVPDRMKTMSMTDEFSGIEMPVSTTGSANNEAVQLNRLFDLSVEMLCVADTDGYLIRVNPTWTRVLGYTPQELNGMRFLDLVHPDDVQSTLDIVSRLVRQESVVNFINRYRHKDGSWRYIEWFSQPEGRLVYAASRDVTERLNYERELRDSREQYRALFENAIDGISVIQDRRFVLNNPKMCQLTGFAADDLVRMNIMDLVHPDDRDAAIASHLRRLEDASWNETVEIRLTCRNGAIIWVEVGGTQIHWNEAPAVLTFFKDITNRKKTESELRTSEEKYRMLAEWASDVIWVHNLTRREFTYISPSVEQQRGFTVEEAARQTLQEAHSPESVTSTLEAFRREMDHFVSHPEDQRVYVNQVRQTVKGGGYKWIETATRYRRNEMGEIEAIGVSRDIDERKLAEEKILQLSLHDQLTGLYNRRFYEEELKRLNTRRNLPTTLVIADVNGLKLVNDAFGHLAGDRLLVRVAEIIRGVSRADDIIARIGGDEFVMLLPKTDSDEAEIIVRRIRQVIATDVSQPAVLSVSFGWATRRSLDEMMESVFTEAENGMYRSKLTESSSMRSETIKIVTNTLYRKSPTEQSHGRRVSMMCGAIAQALGLSADEAREMITAGLLHDIGKIALDERLLDTPVPLTDEDWVEIRRHPEIGYQILRASSEFTGIAASVLSHHEKMDGSGYPQGIRGNDIPLGSRILAVAEAFDEMTSDRKYRKNLNEKDAAIEIYHGAGRQFDESVARAFVERVLGKSWGEAT